MLDSINIYHTKNLITPTEKENETKFNRIQISIFIVYTITSDYV